MSDANTGMATGLRSKSAQLAGAALALRTVLRTVDDYLSSGRIIEARAKLNNARELLEMAVREELHG